MSWPLVILVALSWLAISFLALAIYGLSRQVLELRRGFANWQGTAAPIPLTPPELLAVSYGSLLISVYVDSTCMGCIQRIDDYCAGEYDRHGVKVVFVAYRHDAEKLRVRLGESLIAIADTFESLHLPATPYGAAIFNGEVIVAAPLGSSDALHSLIEGAKRNVANEQPSWGGVS